MCLYDFLTVKDWTGLSNCAKPREQNNELWDQNESNELIKKFRSYLEKGNRWDPTPWMRIVSKSACQYLSYNTRLIKIGHSKVTWLVSTRKDTIEKPTNLKCPTKIPSNSLDVPFKFHIKSLFRNKFQQFFFVSFQNSMFYEQRSSNDSSNNDNWWFNWMDTTNYIRIDTKKHSNKTWSWQNVFVTTIW